MRTAIWISLCFLLLADRARGTERPAPHYRVIVNPQNPLSTADRKFLAEVFLKKRSRWGNNEAIRPVDLVPRASVRHEFSDKVLDRSVSAVKSYWQQIIFSGRGVPPPELGTDDEVVSYVLRYKWAIGYVSAEVDLRGAKVVEVK